MTLVAGLVIAALAIAAAFYYSMRPGRSRVRAGARPGRADVDQELWPIETFGGVSDEQFWDDLAADRTLTSTARTAPADSGSGTQSARSYPATRPTAADRTAVQAAVRAAQVPATPSPMTTQAYPARTQPSATAAQPVHAVQQPAGSRGRRSATAGGPGTDAGGPGTDEDPLTSPAYSLRAKGAVDGHSYQSSDRYRADPLGPDGYSPGSSASAAPTGAHAYQPGPGSAGRHSGTAAYLYHGQPRSQSTQATASASTPPYGDRYGYRNPVSRADDLTSATGNRGHGRPGGNGIGEGHRDSYRAHPAVNGYRGSYDPWGYGRR